MIVNYATVISIINCIIEYPQERARLLVCDVPILEFSVPVCSNYWGRIGKNCAISSFLKIVLLFGNKDHYVYAVAADRKAASRLDSSLRSKHSSGLPRRPTSAKVSHTIPSTTTSTRFLSSQQQAFGYTTYYTTIRSIPLCIVYQGRRVPAPLHIFFFSPAHHHRAVCPPPPPAAGSFAAHRRTPPFFKVSSAWKSDVKRNITQKSDPLFLLAWPWFMIFVWLSTSSLW